MRVTKATPSTPGRQRGGRAFVRFDYSGHGESGGAFEDGTISRWLEEALAVIDALRAGAPGPGRLLDGRLARAARRPRAPADARRQAPRRPRPDRPRGRFHRAADVGRASRRSVRAQHRARRASIPRPSAYSRRSLSDHPRPDRGRPPAPPPRRPDRDRLPGPHPAGHAGSGRALGARACASSSTCPATTSRSPSIKDGDHRLSRPEDIERIWRVAALRSLPIEPAIARSTTHEPALSLSAGSPSEGRSPRHWRPRRRGCR